VSRDGTTWVNLKNYNLFGESDPRLADLAKQARRTVAAAQQNKVNGIAPVVEFHFANGVTPEVAKPCAASK
jgi:hypothetical protein